MTRDRAAAVQLAAAIFAAVLLISAPTAADAAVKTVFPEKFKRVENTEESTVFPAFISSSGGREAVFWAPLKLPVGATIRKLRLYSWDLGNNPHTAVYLFRTKFNRPAGIVSSLIMATGNNPEAKLNSPPDIAETTSPFFQTSDIVVRRGYRYFLMAVSADEGVINSVKVFYR